MKALVDNFIALRKACFSDLFWYIQNIRNFTELTVEIKRKKMMMNW